MQVPGSTYTEGFRGIWTIPCDIALPCATQNEIDRRRGCQEHRQGRCHGRGRGRQHALPLPRPSPVFQKAGLLFAPAKAANAGGVASQRRWR